MLSAWWCSSELALLVELVLHVRVVRAEVAEVVPLFGGQASGTPDSTALVTVVRAPRAVPSAHCGPVVEVVAPQSVRLVLLTLTPQELL